MRKFLVTSMVGGVMAAGALLMPAHAAVPGTTKVDAGPAGSVSVIANGNPGAASGELVLQGNGGPTPISHGYIGVNSTEGVVGCANGTYTGSGDNKITAIPPVVAAPAPPAPGPCNPAP